MLELMEIVSNQPVEKNEWRDEFPTIYNLIKRPKVFLWNIILATDKWLKSIIFCFAY
jgi:hypothetical protein